MSLIRPPVVLTFTFLVYFGLSSFSTVTSNNTSQALSTQLENIVSSSSDISINNGISTDIIRTNQTYTQQYIASTTIITNGVTVSLEAGISNHTDSIYLTVFESSYNEITTEVASTSIHNHIVTPSTSVRTYQSSYTALLQSPSPSNVDNGMSTSGSLSSVSVNPANESVSIRTSTPNLTPGPLITSSILKKLDSSSKHMTIPQPESTASSMEHSSEQSFIISSPRSSATMPVPEPSPTVQSAEPSATVPSAMSSETMPHPSPMVPSVGLNASMPHPVPSPMTPGAESTPARPNPEPTHSSIAMYSSVFPEPTTAAIPSFDVVVFFRLRWWDLCGPLLTTFNRRLAELLNQRQDIVDLNATDIIQKTLKCESPNNERAILRLYVMNPTTKTPDRELTQEISNLITSLVEQNNTSVIDIQFSDKIMSANFEDTKPPPTKKTKWPIWLMVLIGVGALAIICWLSCCICLCCAKKKKKPRRYSYQIGSLHIPKGKLDKEGEQGWKNYENFYGERIGAKKNEALELYGERTDSK